MHGFLFAVSPDVVPAVLNGYAAARRDRLIRPSAIGEMSDIDLRELIPMCATMFGWPQAQGCAPVDLGDERELVREDWLFEIPQAALPALADLAGCDEVTMELLAQEWVAAWPEARDFTQWDFAETARVIGKVARQALRGKRLLLYVDI